MCGRVCLCVRACVRVCGCVMLADFSVLDGVCLLLYANKLDLDQDSPLDVNEVPPTPISRPTLCSAIEKLAPCMCQSHARTPADCLMLWLATVDRRPPRVQQPKQQDIAGAIMAHPGIARITTPAHLSITLM